MIARAWRPVLASALALAMCAFEAKAQASVPETAASIEVELNELEDVDGICRAYFIVRNNAGSQVTALELDTFLFDREGIILQRVALPFGAAPTGRMRIVSFDLEIACSAIGSVFVNDILACEASEALDCAAALETTSRAGPSFE